MFSILSPLLPVLQLPGAIGALVVDADSGNIIERAGMVSLELESLAEGASTVLLDGYRRERMTTPGNRTEDILTSRQNEYHVMRPLTGKGSAGLFLYVVLVRSVADIEQSRRTMSTIAARLAF